MILVVERTPAHRRGLLVYLAEGLPHEELAEHDGSGGIESLLAKMDDVVADVLVLDRRALFGLRSVALVVDVVLRVWPGLGVVITSDEDDPGLVAALSLGARGVISRDAEKAEVVGIITEVARGTVSLSGDLGRQMAAHASTAVAARPDLALSAREIEVLAELASGAGNQEVADTLGISVNTVKNHLRNINEKLGVSNRTEAAMVAVREGLVRPRETPR